MHGIAAGVAYLHDHGIVHRDLKPGNIFVDEGIVKIGDYGLSKFISCSRRSGQTDSVGTVHYMAPEIANGRYGKEIDIYALGIILYEMLTGHVPFEGESVGEMLMKHLTAEPDVGRLAEPYRTIVARALAKDPAKRFTSVNELIALLPPVPTAAALHGGRPVCRPECGRVGPIGRRQKCRAGCRRRSDSQSGCHAAMGSRGGADRRSKTDERRSRREMGSRNSQRGCRAGGSEELPPVAKNCDPVLLCAASSDRVILAESWNASESRVHGLGIVILIGCRRRLFHLWFFEPNGFWRIVATTE